MYSKFKITNSLHSVVKRCSILIRDHQIVLVPLWNVIAELQQLLLHLLAVLETVQPTVVVELGHLSAVLLWQMRWQDVLVQRLHVLSVEVDLLLHALVQERLEHLEGRIERPVLVDDVNRHRSHRHAGLGIKRKS